MNFDSQINPFIADKKYSDNTVIKPLENKAPTIFVIFDPRKDNSFLKVTRPKTTQGIDDIGDRNNQPYNNNFMTKLFRILNKLNLLLMSELQKLYPGNYKKHQKNPFDSGLTTLPKFNSKDFKPVDQSVKTNDIKSNFFEALANRESGGNYGAKNQLGYLGKYQFGKTALQDIGFIDNSGNWTGKNGVYNEKDFLNNHKAQEGAMKEFTQLQWKRLKALGADKYIGQVLGGVKITKSGLIAAAHLGGPGNVIKFLKSGGNNIFADGNGIPVTQYMAKFSGYDVASIV